MYVIKDKNREVVKNNVQKQGKTEQNVFRVPKVLRGECD